MPQELGAKFGQALFGGGERFFFFAEGEADLGGAVVWVVVEAGARDRSDADFFDEIFCEAHVAGGGGKALRVGIGERGNVGHDVVGAARFVDLEAGSGENFQQSRALFGVSRGEFVVVRLRLF